jgi:hypothetical protein
MTVGAPVKILKGHFLHKSQQRHSFTKNLRHKVFTCSVGLETPGLYGHIDGVVKYTTTKSQPSYYSTLATEQHYLLGASGNEIRRQTDITSPSCVSFT